MAESVTVDHHRRYPCGITVTGPTALPDHCPEHGRNCAALVRIARILTAELSPWKFNGSEPMCRDLLDAARPVEDD